MNFNPIIRILSAMILLPVYIFLFMTDNFSGIPLLILSSLVTVICLFEFYQIVSSKKLGKPFIIPGIITALIINIMMYYNAFGNILGISKYLPVYDIRPFLFLLVIFIFIIALIHITKRKLDGGIFSLSTTLFGLVFIVIFFSHIILIKALPNGKIYIFLMHFIIMVNDSFAYFGGMLFGKHKVGFEVSPNKSWEGYFSGMLFGIIAVMVTNEVLITFFDKVLFTKLEAALLGIILCVLGDLGDLIESSIKRDAQIKDSGSIVPGHGGMWDVFDSITLAMPVFYYFLKIKGV